MLGDVAQILGAQHAVLRRVAKQFQPQESIKAFVLNDVDTNWRSRNDTAFAVELLLQPNVLQVMPLWLTFQPQFDMTAELINTVIDLDEPKIVRLLTSYQVQNGIVPTLDTILRDYLVPTSPVFDSHVHRLHIAQGSKLYFYYRRPRRLPRSIGPSMYQLMVGPQSELRDIFDLATQGLVGTYDTILWYNAKSGRGQVYPRYELDAILHRHLLPFDERARGDSDITRLPQAVFKFLLEHVSTSQARDLLEYTIGSTSPLYYSWYLDKFGVPTPAALAQEVPYALRASNFGLWAGAYQPEILLAKQIADNTED